jgi:DNA-binding NtrC family response regulator
MNDREKSSPLSDNGDGSERILIVDDDPSMRTALMETVKRLGYSVQGAVDGMDAIERLVRFRPWMVLTDLRMPRLNGLELIKEVKARAPQATIVLMGP